MADPVGEWKFRLDAAGAETERLRRKVNASLAALAEIAAEPVDS